MKKLTINPIKSISGSVFIPGSKSISNRVLLLSSLSYKKNEIINLLDSDDVNNMIIILSKLGVKIKKISDISESYEIIGFKNLLEISNDKEIILDSGNAGTVIRSILSLISIFKKSNIILTGDKRMKNRPIEDLVNSLLQGGAKIKYLEKHGFPPLKIYGGYVGGNININSSLSSQFLSSLLMISPILEKSSTINIIGDIVSKPYIDITLNLIKKFGVNIENYNYKKFYIKGNQKYISPNKFYIEGDASSASYFISSAVIKNNNLKILGSGINSIQGDIKFSKILNNLGANIKLSNYFTEVFSSNNNIKSFDVDANDIPDSAMTLLIIALLNKNKSSIRNIYNWRIKETDRLYAMSNELKKIGINVFEGNDYISILPNKKLRTAEIETYNDHRIAMCFSLIPLFGIPITIINPKCVNKTFPKYFDYLYKISKFY